MINDEIKSTLHWRATILANAERLIKYGSQADNSQLSLFGNDNKQFVKLEEPQEVDYNDILDKEKDVLGVNLIYNVFDRYILIAKRFCNNTVRSLVEKTESASGIAFLAMVTDIEYKKSGAGNNYAKIYLRDNDSTIRVYLWGDVYRKNISRIYKNKIYLVEVNYNKEKDTTSITNIKDVEEIEIERFVKSLTIYLDDARSAVLAKFYIDNKMFGSQYNLYFNYNDEVFKAPFKINFNEENYLYLKNIILDIGVEK